jgi:hypothetical protein
MYRKSRQPVYQSESIFCKKVFLRPGQAKRFANDNLSTFLGTTDDHRLRCATPTPSRPLSAGHAENFFSFPLRPDLQLGFTNLNFLPVIYGRSFLRGKTRTGKKK